MKPRLLFVLNEAWFFLSHRVPIARAAIAAGYEVHLAANAEPGDVRKVEDLGIVFHALPLNRGSKSPLHDLRTVIALWLLLRKLRPVLVHNVTLKPVIYGGTLARLLGIPACVNAMAGLGYSFSSKTVAARIIRRIATLLFRVVAGHKNSRFILQNPDDAAALQRAAVKPGQIVLIRGSGVDTARFTPRHEPGGKPVVMLATRMLRDKGVREFVEAAEILLKAGSNASFVLAGKPDPANPTSIPESQLRAWAGIPGIEWWGFREDMAEAMARAAVICLPSYYGEGVPKVLLEAAASGRPIVTTDMPGCREVVQDGINGLLVPPRSSAQLAKAIGKLLGSTELRARMGAASREIAVSQFSVDHVVAQTLGVYRTLLASAGGPA